MNYLRQNYSNLQSITNGRYGKIYSANNKEGKIIIIKMIDLIQLPKDDKILVEKEVGINKQLNSPYIVKFYDSEISIGYQYIILEYCNGGDLRAKINSKIETNTCFTQKNIKDWSYQILSALDHIHSLNIIHRDIKPENIILSNINGETVCKIADFGLSWQLENDLDSCTTFTGTPLYMAPEVIKNTQYNCKVDIWSLGVLLYELIYLTNPFDGEEMEDVLHNVLTMDIPKVDYKDENIKSMITKMLDRDINSRPSAHELICSKAFIPSPKQTLQPYKIPDSPRLTSLLLKPVLSDNTNNSRSISNPNSKPKEITPLKPDINLGTYFPSKSSTVVQLENKSINIDSNSINSNTIKSNNTNNLILNDTIKIADKVISPNKTKNCLKYQPHNLLKKPSFNKRQINMKSFNILKTTSLKINNRKSIAKIFPSKYLKIPSNNIYNNNTNIHLNPNIYNNYNNNNNYNNYNNYNINNNSNSNIINTNNIISNITSPNHHYIVKNIDNNNYNLIHNSNTSHNSKYSKSLTSSTRLTKRVPTQNSYFIKKRIKNKHGKSFNSHQNENQINNSYCKTNSNNNIHKTSSHSSKSDLRIVTYIQSSDKSNQKKKKSNITRTASIGHFNQKNNGSQNTQLSSTIRKLEKMRTEVRKSKDKSINKESLQEKYSFLQPSITITKVNNRKGTNIDAYNILKHHYLPSNDKK